MQVFPPNHCIADAAGDVGDGVQTSDEKALGWGVECCVGEGREVIGSACERC